jgi:hypothetical protein
VAKIEKETAFSPGAKNNSEMRQGLDIITPAQAI